MKLIQRYSGLAARIRTLLEQISNCNQQSGELTENSSVKTGNIELNMLLSKVDERLQALSTDTFEGRKEVDLLIEIEEFRQKIAFYDHLVKTMNLNNENIKKSSC